MRAVITEGNATTVSHIVTMEPQNATAEESEFENVGETRIDLPLNYPDDNTYTPNWKVSELSITTGHTTGPAKVLRVGSGDTLNVLTKYWFEDDEQGNPLNTVTAILTDLAQTLITQGTGIIPAGEGGLAEISNTNSYQYSLLSDFITNAFDDLNLDLPQGYLVYIFFDENLRIHEEHSGVRRVETADVLGQLAVMDRIMPEGGYFYTYVTNQSAKSVTYDNFTITHKQGNLKARY